MTIVITDSTILIILVKVNLIEELLKLYGNILIPEEIFNEVVIKGKKNMKDDAIYIEKRIQEGLIKIHSIKDTNHKEKLIKDFNIHDGEAECIVLYFEKKADILGTDDRKTRNICKIFNIPNFSCLSFVLFCLNKNIFTENQALIKLDKINEIGWYKKNLILQVKKQIMEVK